MCVNGRTLHGNQGFTLHLLSLMIMETPQSRRERSLSQSSSALLTLVYIPCTLSFLIVCTNEQFYQLTLPAPEVLEHSGRCLVVSEINFLADKSRVSTMYPHRSVWTSCKNIFIQQSGIQGAETVFHFHTQTPEMFRRQLGLVFFCRY